MRRCARVTRGSDGASGTMRNARCMMSKIIHEPRRGCDAAVSPSHIARARARSTPSFLAGLCTAHAPTPVPVVARACAVVPGTGASASASSQWPRRKCVALRCVYGVRAIACLSAVTSGWFEYYLRIRCLRLPVPAISSTAASQLRGLHMRYRLLPQCTTGSQSRQHHPVMHVRRPDFHRSTFNA